MTSSTRGKRYLTELLGTFTLVTVGCGSAMVASRTHAFGHTAIALAFGLVVTMVVAAAGHLSGAHVNPAVTIGFWSIRRFPASDVVPYVAAQCIGAILGSLFLAWTLGNIANMGGTVPSIPVAQAFAVEMGFSGVLAFVIMSVATDERTTPSLAPFVIGATVFAGALVTGPITGGSFNPARSLGPSVVSGDWTVHWLYWGAPVIGMVLAMRLYDLLRGADATTPHTPLGVEGPID
ncbi:MAG: MIP family channel protein [Gemmatimonadaceae bacterium]